MAKILLIDDYPLTRTGLSLILSAEPDIQVCCQASDAKTAEALMQKARPDLAIVELGVPGMIGVELIRMLHKARSSMKILVLSRFDELLYAEPALRAGANGYVMKKEEVVCILAAVRRVLAGEVVVSEAVNRQLLEGLQSEDDRHVHLPSEVLSRREREIFELTGQGISTHDIAERLNLSVKTVDSYRHRIKQKLHLNSSNEIAYWAIRWVEREGIR